MSSLPLHHLTGWLLDVYPVHDGMAIWLLDDEGSRRRLVDPYEPAFYLAGRHTDIALATHLLTERHIVHRCRAVERRELWDADTIPVSEISIVQPTRFQEAVKLVMESAPHLRFYEADVPLPQLYFYDRHLFPLCRCDADITGDAIIQAIQASDSPWDTNYGMPPLSIIELILEGTSPNPNHGGVFNLLVRIEGTEWRVEEENAAEFVETINGLFHRYDPDILLTEWGDSYLLPRLMHLARLARVPLMLNRDTTQPIAMRAPRSYFSYGHVVAQAGSQTLYGRLHLDRHNSFALAETGVAGLFEQARVTKVPIQQMARTTTGTGITSMQLERAHQDGILIPYRKQQAESFKTAFELLETDQGGLTYAPLAGYHESVGELDFASMYPAIMVQFNVSPETVNCACCKHNPAALVPEIQHYTCRQSRGLVPKTLAPLLAKRGRYKRQLKNATNAAMKQIIDQRQTALKWLLVVSFGYLGYKNARFGRIEAHESVTAYSRDVLLRAKDISESQEFRLLHAIVDSLWLQKKGASREDYEQLAMAISAQTKLSIAVEGLYRWIGFLPSRVDPRMPVHNQFVGLFDDGRIKVRGLEIRRSDAPLIVKRAQTEILQKLSQGRTIAELEAIIPDVLGIVDEYCSYLREGRASVEEVAIGKTLTRPPERYRHATRTSIAAKELQRRGVSLQPGETIHYVICDSQAALPEDRVRAVAGYDGTIAYDTEAYVQLVHKAALAMLAPLGVRAKELERKE
ncbi:MAG TPA: DNA polymerase domain-containing protein [Nitrospiraceae bacterium]|nr:DNA polymerase domain-containing protein [Nitrospiraceae bacterium]